jgi:hypothetical protein
VTTAMILEGIIRTIARKVVGAERAEKFARYRARVIELEKQFESEVLHALATFAHIKGRDDENR